MSVPAKILYVVNDARFFLSHRLPLAQAAQANGYEVHIATPKDDASKTISSYGFKFHSVILNRRSMHLLDELKSFLCLYRLYKDVLPDIVHHVTIKPVIYGGIASRLARLPAVVNALTGLGYVFVGHGFKVKALRVIVKLALRLSLNHHHSMVIFQNPDDLALFIRRNVVRKANAVLIRGSGVNMTHFYPVMEPSGIPVIVLASRMLWHKGIGDFVDAARYLHNRVTARFVLIGNSDAGNPENISEGQLQAWANEKFIELWGWRENMATVFNQAHIVCLPSYREGVPKILIEAAACGRPIVTTDTPGCREIVQHGVNGFLVPPRDSSALANALKQLIEDPELRRQMGRAGREIAVSEFSLEKVVNETLAVYQKLLACAKS